MEAKVPRLLLQGGTDKGREILLTGGHLSVGRQEDNDIVIADRLASRRHARLERERGQYYVQDVGSRNGTYVNGQRLTEPHLLRDGDEIQIGLEFKAVYVDPEATGALVTDALIRGTGLWVDQERREVWVRGSRLSPPLSRSQFTLLNLVREEPGRVYSRDEIVQAVWPEAAQSGVSEETIDALVGRLRRRIARADPDHDYIVTVRGHGFKFMQPWER
jgi:DNA-binding response OmpR family regulator